MDKSHVDDGRKKKAVELKIEERGKRKEGNRIFKGKKVVRRPPYQIDMSSRTEAIQKTFFFWRSI